MNLNRTGEIRKGFGKTSILFLGKKINFLSLQRLISENGDRMYEGPELAEHINNFFVKIGPSLANDIIKSCGVNPESEQYQGPVNINSDNITNKEITTIDLENLLKKS